MSVQLYIRKNEYPVLVSFGFDESYEIQDGDSFRIEVYDNRFKNAVLFHGTAEKPADDSTANVEFKAAFSLDSTVLAGIRARNLRTGKSWVVNSYSIEEGFTIADVEENSLIYPRAVDFSGYDFGFGILTTNEHTSITAQEVEGVLEFRTTGRYYLAMYRDGVFYLKIGQIERTPQLYISGHYSDSPLEITGGNNTQVYNITVIINGYKQNIVYRGGNVGYLSYYADGLTKIEYFLQNEWGYLQSTSYLNNQIDKTVINLYSFSGENNLLDKTSKIGSPLVVLGNFREGFNVSYPMFTINRTINPTYNYAFIPSLGRWYYIKSVTNLSKDFWSIELVVDVLMTWAYDIRKQPAIVSRNEFKYNNMLVDVNVPCELDYSLDYTQASPFMTKFKGLDGEEKSVEWDFNDTRVIIDCISAYPTSVDSTSMTWSPMISPAHTVYEMSYGMLDTFITKTLTPNFFESLGDAFQNHSDFIAGVYLSPIDITKAQGASSVLYVPDFSEVMIGTKVVDDVTANLVISTSKLRMWSKINIDKEKSFIDMDGFSKYLLFLPFIGLVEIDAFCVYHELKYIIYDIDIVTGDILATLYPTEPTMYDALLSEYIWKGNMYLKVPLGATNMARTHLNSLMTTISLGTSLATTAAKTSLGVSKGLSSRTPKTKKVSAKGKRIIGSSIEKGIFESAGAIFDSTLDYIAGSVPSGTTMAFSDDSLKYRFFPFPILAKFTPKYYYPDNYNHSFGRPLQEYVKSLGELSGYTEVSEVHLNGYSHATLEERNDIEESLIAGIIINEVIHI